MSYQEHRTLTPDGRDFAVTPPLRRIEGRIGRKLTLAERSELETESRSANPGQAVRAVIERLVSQGSSVDSDLA